MLSTFDIGKITSDRTPLPVPAGINSHKPYLKCNLLAPKPDLKIWAAGIPVATLYQRSSTSVHGAPKYTSGAPQRKS